MNKKMIIIIVVIAVAVTLSLVFLVPAFAQAPPEAEPPEISAEELDSLEEADSSEQPPIDEPVVSSIPQPSALSTPEAAAKADMSKEEVAYKGNKVEYSYHDIESDTQKKMEVAAEAQSDYKFGLEVVAQQVFGQTLEQSPLNPNYISFDNGKLYIDFSKAIYNANFGTAGEGEMLDNIASAYLNNLEEITEIYYSVDGGNYSTGHFEISGGTPYMQK